MSEGSKPSTSSPGFVLGTTFKDGFNICLTDGMDRNATISYAESFGSDHPGGSHFAFCDGGVRFVFDSVDPAVMNALATRASLAKEGKADPVIHQSPFRELCALRHARVAHNNEARRIRTPRRLGQRRASMPRCRRLAALARRRAICAPFGCRTLNSRGSEGWRRQRRPMRRSRRGVILAGRLL